MEKFLDVNEWKEFSVKELGFVCHHGQRLNQSERKDGPIPFVTAGFQNHGVTQYISNDRPTYHKAITVDMFGNCFFQTDDCAGDDNVYFFVNDKLTDCSKLFVSACIAEVTSKKFSYTKQFRQHDANVLKVFLPVTPSSDPDWAYMDSFMGKILEEEEVAAEQLVALAPESEADGHFLDVSGWKAFHLYDIFHIDMGNKFDRGKMPIGDKINFVGRTGLNNGINATCEAVDKVEPYPPGLITLALGGTIGACFVQPKKFYTSQNVIVLNPKQKLSFAVKTFISAIIWRVSDMYYDAFSNELNRHIKTDFVFWLPVTSDGQPDWAWMEQYMQQQLDKTEKLAEHLNELNLQKH